MRLAHLLIFAAIVVAFSETARAAKYATSDAPFWRVGTINPKLSRACQRGEFGQVNRYLYNIGFIGPTGRALTGIATDTWNLYDPRGLAEAFTTYHFFNQGYSNCKVYVAPIPPNQRR